MKLTDKIIMEDYKRYRPDFLEIEAIVVQRLEEIIEETGIRTLVVQHRVKAENSLKGKLLRVEGKYTSFEQLTDILGVRIVCFFSDEIDKLGKEIEKNFVIDWENTSDKRKQIDVNSFGYLSMHYICSLPADKGYPERLLGKKFEVQIRTALQHVWSEISHNTGYKSQFGLPRAINRDFSRMAGLLEIADDQFMHIRDGVDNYNAEIRQKITENRADDLPINVVSIHEYLRLSGPIRALNAEIAAFSGAEIDEIDATNYISQLDWLNIKTLGDLDSFVERNRALALEMARSVLEGSELDIVSNVVGLRYLCRAELINGNYSKEQAARFLSLVTGSEERGFKQTKALFERYGK